MRRYKLAVHILVILSVFNFVPVLAAPVAVREMREAYADAAEGRDDVIIVSGKRADEGQGPLTQASLPPSTSDYVNGVHQETTNPIQPPSSASGRTGLPWYSSDYTGPRLLNPGRGGVQQVQPGTSVRTKTQPWVATTEIGPATPSPSESPGETPPASPGETPPASPGETPPASPNKVPPGSPEWGTSDGEKYPAQVQENQPKPGPNNFFGKLAIKSKIFFRKLGKVFKSLLGEMANPRLQIRISATASGAVNAAQRELQGKVHTETYVSTSFLSYKHSDLMLYLSITR
jgi:hypothetical protein